MASNDSRFVLNDVSISYSGSPIAELSSGTKTVNTEGNYCVDDIVVSYTRPDTRVINADNCFIVMSDMILVPIDDNVLIMTSDGRIVSFNDGWSPWGNDATLIATYNMGTTTLSNTDYPNWVPSTTASSIQATSNLGTIESASLNDYEYIIKTVFESNTTYTSGTTLNAAVVRQIFEIIQVIYRKPSTLSNLTNEVEDTNYCTTMYTAPFMEYYTTKPAHAMTYTGSYGIYPAATAASFSSATSVNPTITVKAPTYNARCYKSYFSTTMANAVDQESSTITCKVYVYRIKKAGSVLYRMYKEIADLYNAT